MPLASQANERMRCNTIQCPLLEGTILGGASGPPLSSPHLQIVDEVLDAVGTPDEHKEEQPQGDGQGHHPQSDQDTRQTQPGPHNGPTEVQRTTRIQSVKDNRLKHTGIHRERLCPVGLKLCLDRMGPTPRYP